MDISFVPFQNISKLLHFHLMKVVELCEGQKNYRLHSKEKKYQLRTAN